MSLSHKQAMEEVYSDDVFPYLGLHYCHMGYWEDDNPDDFHRAQEAMLLQVVETLAIAPTDHILDVGGGNGATAIWLAKRYGCRVLSADIVENNHQHAQAAIQAAGLEGQVSSMCCDVMDLEMGEQVFDHIISVGALHHFADKAGLFQRLWRMLKPGGSLVGSAYQCSLGWPLLRELYLDLTVASRYLDSMSTYKTLLSQVGFDNIHSRDISPRVLLQSATMLTREPYYSGLHRYGVAHYGRLATMIGLPLLKLLNLAVLRRQGLGLHIIQAEKPV